MAETVICTATDDSKVSYRLDFDWTAERAEIQSAAGEKLFSGATIVRNGGGDLAFLAEGTRKNYVGQLKGCGGIITQLYFDVANVNGQRAGTLEATDVWMIRGGDRKSCRPQFRVPDVATTTYQITCK